MALVILAELVLRIGPIQALLSEKLDPYENLLWYHHTLPRYQNQLLTNPDYTIWLLGSSPLMTGLDPAIIQEKLRRAGYEGITIQNYGFSNLLHLGTMAQTVDRWLLELDQPKYVVIGISERNFRMGTASRSLIEDSPLENIMIFPDNIDDHIARFLYTNSTLYHYLILARNATIIPIGETERNPLPLGGYNERFNRFDCDGSHDYITRGRIPLVDLAGGLDRLDQLIDAIQDRDIPVLVVNIPVARCVLDDRFRAIDYYRTAYLEPVGEHLRNRGIPFFEIDSAFYKLPLKDQNGFFDNAIHPNVDGARFMSSLLADYLSG